MCDLHKAYENYFGDLMVSLLKIDKDKAFSEDDLFSTVVMDKAYAYDIRNTDIVIYSLFSFMNPPNSLGNFIKIPQQRIMMDKFLNDKPLVQKKIAEVFETKVIHNKNMNKAQKNKFDHYMLSNLENKLLMALEVIDFFKKQNSFDIEQAFSDMIDSHNYHGATLFYFLSYIMFDEETTKKLKQYVEEKGELVKQRVRFQIEVCYAFATDILRLAKPERYELFIDEQLSKISEYIKNEKEVLLKAYEQDEKNYLDMVDNLTTRLNSLEKENAELKNTSMKKTSPLNNKKVLVVGDTGRKEGYKQIVEQYGGHFDFVDGIFEKDKLSVVSESADVAILIVPRIKHTVSHILKANKVPVIFVNSAGIGAFEDVVDKYCS